MVYTKLRARLVSLGVLSTLLLFGPLVTSANARDRDGWNNGRRGRVVRYLRWLRDDDHHRRWRHRDRDDDDRDHRRRRRDRDRERRRDRDRDRDRDRHDHQHHDH
jgi:hypothetical protein